VEDLNVSFMSKWPYNKGKLNPKISNGIMIGLDTMINMQGLVEGTKSKTSLVEYLREEVELNPKLKVRVFGWSLGGSLATVMGLYLYENQVIWNPMGTATLKVHSVAGFTTGNNDFKIYYESRLLDNTMRTWNTLDIVPKLFAENTMSQIAPLYEPYIKTNIIIESLMKVFELLAGCNGYCQVLQDAIPLIGTYYPVLLDNTKPLVTGFQSIYNDYTRFMDEVTYQHAQGYFNILGIGELWFYFPFSMNIIHPPDVDNILTLVTDKMKDITFVSKKELEHEKRKRD